LRQPVYHPFNILLPGFIRPDAPVKQDFPFFTQRNCWLDLLPASYRGTTLLSNDRILIVGYHGTFFRSLLGEFSRHHQFDTWIDS